MLYETRKNKNPDEERPRTETSGTQTRNYSVRNNPNPYADRVQSLEKQGAPIYTQSPEVSSLKNKWQQTENSKPQNFSYANQGVIQQLTDQILNRKPFTYDVNADPLYQQYKDSYMHNGRLAMMDTTAQMSGLTGGYGNSYAASAGNQAYQGYLTQLNNVIPELYEAAYNRSLREEENMRNNLAMLENQKNFDYSIYRDQMGDWKENRNFDYGAYIDASERDYGRHRDQVGDYYTDLGNAYGRYDQDNADYMWGEQMNENAHQYDKNFSYQELRDAIADSQWQQSFAYQKEQDDIANKRADKQLEVDELKYKYGLSEQYDSNKKNEQGKKRSWMTNTEASGLAEAAKKGDSEVVKYISDLNLTDDYAEQLYEQYLISRDVPGIMPNEIDVKKALAESSGTTKQMIIEQLKQSHQNPISKALKSYSKTKADKIFKKK